MEKNEKIEKPEWIEEVGMLPEIIRQDVGRLCAGVIGTLVHLYCISIPLYDAVRNEASSLISSHFAELEKRNND